MSVCDSVLYQIVSEGAGGSGICVYRILWIYFASAGILFHAVSVNLQRLPENIFIFPDGNGGSIWACMAARKSLSQRYHIQHATFTYDRIFSDSINISSNHKELL